MANLTVVGAQWGDEGKGKVVDLLTEKADVVIRFAGGNNAGHTLVVDGRKIVVHLLPSGVVRDRCICMLGDGMVVDPAALQQEMESVAAAGIDLTDRLRVSGKAHLILPYHRILDALREETRGALGTTKRGVGPAYEDKAGRRGIRVVELLRPDRLGDRLAVAVAEANARIERLGGNPVDFDEMFDFCVAHGKRLESHIADVSYELDEAVKAGKTVLFEGAQGLLLDLDHGTYPFVTSSTTLAGGASPGVGVSPSLLGNVVGVTKAYLTRVGEGPMPSETDGEAARHLAQVGNEVGATTGRPRRCGWLDLVALRYAVRVSGIRYLALTKLDVLAGMGPIKVCVGYRLDGRELSLPPMDTADWSLVQPIYREVEGFGSLEGVSTFEALPGAAKAYIRMIEQDLDVEVALLSVGPGREASIPLHEVW